MDGDIDSPDFTTPLVTSKSMAKVFFSYNVGTSRLNRLIKLPRFRTSGSSRLHPDEGFHLPTRTRALKKEVQKACDSFADMLTFFGFRPTDFERNGWLFTALNMAIFGFLWPMVDFLTESVEAKDKEVQDMWSLQKYYRLLLFYTAVVWIFRVCRKYDVKTMLFLEVDSFYVSRVAKSKGLGGLWVYVSIIQNFALELMCLFAPYFVVLALGRSWWYFNTMDDNYSVTHKFPFATIDSKSPLALQLFFFFMGLFSQSYIQIVILIPCVYFRVVSSLILLEMKAYKSMVQPSKLEDEDDELAALISENVSMHPSALSETMDSVANSFNGEITVIDEDKPEQNELHDVPPATLEERHELGRPSRLASKRGSVFHRYGSNPFGMYVETSEAEEEEGSESFDVDAESISPAVSSKEHSFPVLREHALLQNVLKLISHRFRQFLLLSFLIIFFEAFGAVYFLLYDIMSMDSKIITSVYNVGHVLLRIELSASAALHVAGLVLNVRAILIMTHRLRSVHSIASEQHAHLTCNMKTEGGISNEDLNREFEQYMKRQALLQYMEDHPLGITIYGFIIDREFLRSFHMVVVSLTVFLVSLTINVGQKKE